MVRPEWTNLNGPWDFAFVAPDGKRAATRKILVPFPVESQLSGIDEMVPEGHSLWYRRSFARPKTDLGERVLLHFGAVDWEARVLVNGKEVGRHQGGYDPFTFDITGHLTDEGDQTLEVFVVDPTDAGPQPRGKQVRRPGGIFYRPSSGIWQTVWLEVVPKSFIRGLDIKTSLDGRVRVQVDVAGDAKTVRAEILDGSRAVSKRATATRALSLVVSAPKLWSPATPFLYGLKVELVDGDGAVVDRVESYVGIREISMQKNAEGQPILHLNGKPIFMFGPLDQGFWPDGLHTPPTDAALRYDLLVTKGLGCNTVRKHVKVESSRFYYWCDRLGLLVMQDMPSGDRSIGPSDPDIQRTPESERIYRRELEAMIRTLKNHPSIVIWIPFNEGWGQFKTDEITKWIKRFDPTRLVTSASGWTDRGTGDIHDVHVYPGPGAPPVEKERASVLGEFGGLGLVIEGHTWQKEGWGYQSYQSREELTAAMERLFANLRLLRAEKGLSGAIYTQTSDVETELNGLLTYDRAMIKPDARRIKRAINLLYRPAPSVSTIVPTSEQEGIQWAFTTDRPADGWMRADFDDRAWHRGEGGFGTPETPGAVVRTRWDKSDIWIRREFVVDEAVPGDELMLRMHHDDDVEVYLDGKLVFAEGRWTTGYMLFPLSGVKELSPGRHTLAIYCHQNRGGQYIDAGLVRIRD